ncbi:uncharacterized protein BO97DRAFT_403201 [Aspergillus homomorphus CBS 101889]|uniref:Uncharacterized protein n=1 Tax=Aspergillus homomorphus (strain CBS 101889) TaxID=1450537 RepID=A0A395I7V2_ASPHC|nr:hypothetical protein BO97DRAFT_403201 [Aspergillus homomorphus CBS 101889]RAL16025.1 hypothetical protein BO97DRAFT_403201 [Aspergillus homomorphus CBS 101889]
MALFRTCRTATVQLRGFSSSSSLRVGPESPNFIDVPRSLQPDLPSKRIIKGTLPVPREIFPARRTDKPTQAYISAATPRPKKGKSPNPNDINYEYIEQKKRMANMRRKNLREGLLELHARKQATDTAMKLRSEQKQLYREKILQQPDREDVRLTRTSIVQEMLPQHMPVLPDPDRETRLRKARSRTQRKLANKVAERRHDMHDLYVNARNFIVNEEQLAAEIEKVFPEGVNEAWRSDHQEGVNIWNLGFPQGISSLASDSRKTESARWDTIQSRIRRLAEEITGGKM